MNEKHDFDFVNLYNNTIKLYLCFLYNKVINDLTI